MAQFLTLDILFLKDVQGLSDEYTFYPPMDINVIYYRDFLIKCDFLKNHSPGIQYKLKISVDNTVSNIACFYN